MASNGTISPYESISKVSTKKLSKLYDSWVMLNYLQDFNGNVETDDG